ncbi:cob(I)yrinic acid a,c-diamide adenosyltransferase [Rubinisphaera margarita]|uniref:cob(I)yrinic acid a,c-diamide adenosyltransferase n=1 Tax=Rubinisphaera margarita TaxID=2909586 RepID=UPI001EE7D048|nr:cob(I)yrinic acid a,c-diamide adenosyltransferase [Rubinisphaera margarita]MCG6154877.1 cob(I)yrinic acid a,c-diamide adenosyltransferase [Rubinisphaera margarita]
MVYLNNITTKTGDGGTTRLGDGSEVSKFDIRIETLGTIEELNAHLGFALAQGIAAPWHDRLRKVQNDLFDLGADLCIPAESDVSSPFRFNQSQTNRLDNWMVEINRKLPPLTSFILPGGTLAAASVHLARTVCRRAERILWQLAAEHEVPKDACIYLNRLSDLLFQISRIIDDPGNPAPLWVPSPAPKA